MRIGELAAAAAIPPAACDGATVAWDAVALPENGTFAGGRAEVRATAFVCSSSHCGVDEAAATVKVTRSR